MLDRNLFFVDSDTLRQTLEDADKNWSIPGELRKLLKVEFCLIQ